MASVVAPGKVTVKRSSETPVNSLAITLTGAYVAPYGTVTVSCVVDALVTEALALPKKTVLLEDVASKLTPVMVIDDPTTPWVGDISEIYGPEKV